MLYQTHMDVYSYIIDKKQDFSDPKRISPTLKKKLSWQQRVFNGHRVTNFAFSNTFKERSANSRNGH